MLMKHHFESAQPLEARFQKPNQFQRNLQRKSSTFPGIARKSTYQFTDFNIKRYFMTSILTEAPTGRKSPRAGSAPTLVLEVYTSSALVASIKTADNKNQFIGPKYRYLSSTLHSTYFSSNKSHQVERQTCRGVVGIFQSA